MPDITDPEYDPNERYYPDITEPGGEFIEQPGEPFGEEFGTEEPTPEEEVQPEELAVNNMFDLIPVAIQQRRHLQITYTSIHKGTTKTYVIEPYEVGGHGQYEAGYLWGVDIAMERTKSFLLAGLNDIQLLDTVFIPRY